MCVHCMYITHSSHACACVCKHVPGVRMHMCSCKPTHCQGRRKGQLGLQCGTLAMCDLSKAGKRDGGHVMKGKRARDTAQPRNTLYLLGGQSENSWSVPTTSRSALGTALGTARWRWWWSGPHYDFHGAWVLLLLWASSSIKKNKY